MISSTIYKLARITERTGAFFQGKGYGSKSINQEISMVEKLLRHSRQNSQNFLMIDIGGNVGDYASALREKFKEAEIHIFEPSAVNLKKITDRFSNDNQIFVNPVGVSDADRAEILYSDKPGSGLSSLSKRRLEHHNVSFDVTEEIKVIRFEGYWEDRLESRRINLAKLDIEGHELSALRGFGNAIKSTDLIQFEFGGCNLDTHTTFQDFYYFFNEHNFDILRITPLGCQILDRYFEIDEFYLTTNFIARNRALS